MANFTGTGGANTFNGTPQADTANMRGGNDTANGRGGNDILRGEGGNDTLNGGDGADTLSGGAGSDRLTGGAGDDTFRFPDSDGVPSTDRVLDFRRGQDEIFVDVGFDELDSDGNGRLNNADQRVSTEGGALVIDYASGESLALNNIQQLTQSDFFG